MLCQEPCFICPCPLYDGSTLAVTQQALREGRMNAWAWQLDVIHESSPGHGHRYADGVCQTVEGWEATD